MSRGGTFTSSPAARGEQRKFINPTPGYVGANVFGGDGKPTAIAVEPGGEVWLTEEEERMTAEAPRSAADNPFVKEWQEPVEFDTYGEPIRTVTRKGILVLADEPPRPIASDRFIPERVPATHMMAGAHVEEREVVGTETPEQPPVEGQPSEGEILGTPEAPEQNEEALAAREPTAEQPTKPRSKALPSD